jgi:aarF domain-containing kinase
MVPRRLSGVLQRRWASLSTTAPRQNRRRTWGIVLGGTGLAGTAFLVRYFHDHFGGGEGLQRAVSFYSVAIPKYLQYRYYQMYESDKQIWEELDSVTSQQGLAKILELKGFYVKCGQMAASNIGDAFPKVWQETMSVLQDRCPEEDYETVIRPILEAELDINAIFQSIDPQPIGSASIGQVHRAILQDGTPVVVKVCYPHVERLLRGDVRTIRAFCEIAQPVHVPSLKEVEAQFQSEFDYRVEARNLETVRQNLLRAKLPCRVPRPYAEYCTKHVLVMEELRGGKLVDVLRQDIDKWAEITGRSVKELEQSHASVSSAAVAALEAQRKLHNAAALLYNWTVGWIASPMSRKSKESVPLDHAKLVDDLLYIHGHEVLVDGLFNADCHPGVRGCVCVIVSFVHYILVRLYS